MRKIEIFEKPNNVHRLTITPDRVTVKIIPGTDLITRKKITYFASSILQEYDRLKIRVGMRGSILPHKEGTFKCVLKDDKHHKENSYSFIGNFLDDSIVLTTEKI